MGSRLALFRCQEDNKKFKIKMLRGDGVLKQYDGQKYNTLLELNVSSTNKRATRHLTDVVKEGIKMAELHSDCDKNEFIIEELDERIKKQDL